jgi:hypothetical protein
MSISSNQETGGRPLSTADLAAAGRRPDNAADGNEEPVVNDEREERISPPAREERTRERIRGQSAAVSEAQQRTPDRPPMDRSTDGPVTKGDARPRGRWFNEEGRTEKGSVPADRPSGDAADRSGEAARSGEALEPLFTPELAESYRARWLSIQSGFVDDPRQAVRRGDELVARVMTDLANTFAEERHRVEGQLDETGEGSTENLRVTLRRYRSFFERLLSL